MKARTFVILAGAAGAGAAAPLLKKTAVPLRTYIIGGGVIAYEAACEMIEISGDFIAHCINKLGKKNRKDECSVNPDF